MPKKTNRKIKFLDDLCLYLGPRNFVSMRKRGTCCIAPKLHGACFEGSKTLRVTDSGVQNSAGQRLKAKLLSRVLDPSICACRVLDLSKCAHSFFFFFI